MDASTVSAVGQMLLRSLPNWQRLTETLRREGCELGLFHRKIPEN
ncbi:hypothetical protein [Synechococcus elongatus]|nr:hypothetical protein [Synechococcus elongatus]WKW06237.1 hypothetical protein QY054_03410 [Synechococcus elongatus PCC 7942 = FACHB-805]